jgi:xylulose-5-phosphate/fructose-6-phosphate phosphoketolase
MKIKTKTLNPELLRKIDAYWRAANYLSVGQIYLYNNPLLKKPLKLAHIKPRLLGHMRNISLRFVFILAVQH